MAVVPPNRVTGGRAVAKRKRASTPPERLAKLRGKRFLESWDTFVDCRMVNRSEASVQKLVEDLILLGDDPDEAKARKAVARCVKRFNRMDETDGWINTIEREDISDVIDGLVTACGFEPDEDWLDDRDW